MQTYLTKFVATPRETFCNKECFREHGDAIRELANGGDLRDTNASENMQKFYEFVKVTWLCLPSNTQFVEAGVKEASLCRSTGRQEISASFLAMLRSATVHSIVSSALKEKKEEKMKNGESAKEKNSKEEKVSGTLRIRNILQQVIQNVRTRGDVPKEEKNRILRNLTSKETHFSRERINNKVEKYKNNLGREKNKNKSQLESGVQYTPIMKGEVMYGQLNNTCLKYMRKEFLLRSLQYSDSWGIRKFVCKLREHLQRSGTTNEFAFKPFFLDADSWADPTINVEGVEDIKRVRYGLKNKQKKFAIEELTLRGIEFSPNDGIKKMSTLIKSHEQEGIAEEFHNPTGFIPRYKDVHEWEQASL